MAEAQKTPWWAVISGFFHGPEGATNPRTACGKT